MKVCDKVVSSEQPERCGIYSFDVAGQVGAVVNQSGCREWCEADVRCNYYAFWSIGWCETSRTCQYREQRPNRIINIVKCRQRPIVYREPRHGDTSLPQFNGPSKFVFELPHGLTVTSPKELPKGGGQLEAEMIAGNSSVGKSRGTTD